MIRKSIILRGVRLLCFCLIFSSTVEADQSPLLVIVQNLHCAQSEQEAGALLKKLADLPLDPFGIPSDNQRQNREAELYAATVDIMLKVLYQTIQRFPGLQEAAEQTVLRWRYCETFNDGDLADLMGFQNGAISKHEAIGPFPAEKMGFGLWGFTRKAKQRQHTPELLKAQPLFPRAYQDLLYQLSHLQCFPISEEGLYQENDPHFYPGFLRLSEPLLEGKRYPYKWSEECKPKPIQRELNKTKKRSFGERLVNGEGQAQTATNISSGDQYNLLTITTPPEQVKVKPVEIAVQRHTRNSADSTQKHSKQPVKKEKKSFFKTLIAEKYVQPGKGETPIISPAIPSGNSNFSAPLPLPPEDGWGLAGNFYHRAKLTGEMSLGVNVSWKPYSYFFVRGGANYNYLPGSGLSYSWGFGYDDWHPGTFSAQVNNWGPITPEKGNFLSGGAANLGYKFVAEWLKPYHLSGSAALNLPFSGDPSISTTWIWSPIEHWFVRASLSKSLTSATGLDWSYSFGYSDWHPFTFSLTYDNWGSNPIFDSSQGDVFNFIENGAITLSWSWAL